MRLVGEQTGSMDEALATNGRLWVSPGDAPVFTRNGLQTLDDLFGVSPARRLDKATLPAWRERLMLELTDELGAGRRYFVKRFQPLRPRRPWRVGGGQLVSSTAGVERHWILTLGAAGLPVPRIAAFGEELAGGRERRSAVVLADVGGVSLETWAKAASGRAPRELINSLADLVRRLHDGRFIHRDLYLCHVFLANGDATTPELVLIDLQRVRYRPWPWTRWAARDVAQLDYSTPKNVAGKFARLRWLKRYLGGASLKSRSARGLMRRIARKSAQIAAHDARVQARLEESRP